MLIPETLWRAEIRGDKLDYREVSRQHSICTVAQGMLAMVSQTFNRIWEQKAKGKDLNPFSLGGKSLKVLPDRVQLLRRLRIQKEAK